MFCYPRVATGLKNLYHGGIETTRPNAYLVNCDILPRSVILFNACICKHFFSEFLNLCINFFYQVIFSSDIIQKLYHHTVLFDLMVATGPYQVGSPGFQSRKQFPTANMAVLSM
jgi:hypothetical protein